ncbi:MAG: hypothetical protein FWE03_02115 [Firmicutes bacterium]|nr:hypothetical protein [Bacillota bacterium]
MEEKKKNSFFNKIKSIKHIEIIIAAIAVGIMLIIYFTSFGGGGLSIGSGNDRDNDHMQDSFHSDYTRRMQAQIVNLVSSMEGAGETRVVINWESSVELILAKTVNEGTNSSSSSPVIINMGGSSRPIIIKEIYPRALGVVVVVAGGENARLRVNIIMTLSVLLNLEPEFILVFPMG